MGDIRALSVPRGVNVAWSAIVTGSVTVARSVAVTLAALLAGSAAGNAATMASAAEPTSPRVHAVKVDGLGFKPAVLVVAPGDRVTWINKDPFPHTVTADGKAFDSGTLAPQASWSFTTQAAGTFAYTCTLHPTMKGKLIVRAQLGGRGHP